MGPTIELAGRPSGVREAVWLSWQRCAASGLDPDAAVAPVVWGDGAAERLAVSPLAIAVPLLRRLVLDGVRDDGMLVLLTDADGHVLWLDGARTVRRRAEQVALIEGATWTERAAGTNAPGLALRTGRVAQVRGAEHFLAAVQPFSCTAAPVHDPVTGLLLGAIDVSGGENAVAPAVAAMVRTAAAVVESELRLAALAPAPARRPAAPAPRLSVLGRDRGELACDGRVTRLSPRHTELLLALVDAAQPGHGAGCSAEELAVRCWDDDVPTVTVRAEMARLRTLLGPLLASRPYRLTAPIGTDADEVAALVDRGSLRRALDAYRGAVLPHSTAPAAVERRELLHRQLRAALLSGAPADLAREFTEQHAPDDALLWRAVLDRLPAGSPQRSRVRARLGVLDQLLG